MFGNDRQQLRKQYFLAWNKYKNKESLSALEKMIADVIAEHPEYQSSIENEDKSIDKDYMPEEGQVNPFLHMGMHIGIHEQLQTGQPQGIREIYQQLQHQTGSTHDAEHLMIDCLAEVMWLAQRNNQMPDINLYVELLNKQIT